MIFNIILSVPILLANISNPFFALGFYSLWGSFIALGSHIFSIIACNRDGWFKVAYISTEISYAVNWIVVLIFWLYLVPVGLQRGEDSGVEFPTSMLVYQGCLHAIPLLTTISDLWMTDMALEKSHTWIAFVVMFPCYMMANWGVATLVRDTGTIYGVEDWNNNPGTTMFVFFLAGIAQAFIFWISCAILDWIYPKRADEEFNLKAEEENTI